jgi:hypothetical protein
MPQPLIDTYLIGVYDDDEVLLDACREIRANGIHIDEVFTPFPVHGLDKVIALKESRLPTVAFLFGCLGLFTAFSLETYTMVIDWPMNVGGKPAFALPAFVPIMFELTVLFTALGMVGVYLYRNQMLPGIEKELADIRQTDDRFVVCVRMSQNDPKTLNKLRDLYQSTGAVDVREKDLDVNFELKDDYNRQ